MTRTIVRIATLALATAALAAPTALARPNEVLRTATAQQAQLTQRAHPVAGGGFGHPALDLDPAQTTPSSPPATVSVTSADRGIDWTTIGIGIAGSLLAVGAIAGITSRTRHHRIAA